MTSQSQSARRAATLASFVDWHRSNTGRFLKASLPQAPAYVLPRQLAPISTANALSYLWSDRSDSPTEELTNARRASWCALNHPQAATQFPQFSGGSGKVPLGVWCPCNPEVRKHLVSNRLPSIQSHETQSSFDPDSLFTDTETVLKIENVSDDLWKTMAVGSNPANWSTQAPDYFKLSEPDYQTQCPPKGLGWTGTLHEVFQWNWNPDYTASYENILNIDFSGDKTSIDQCKLITVDYSLNTCIATDLLLVRQSGGLDIDEGALTLERTSSSSITVTARKRLRYTQPEIAPDGFALMIAYLTPAVLALWLYQSVYQGVVNAIQSLTDDTRKGPPPPPGTTTPTPPALTPVTIGLSDNLPGARAGVQLPSDATT
jgi:hypothetical protein